MAWCVYVHLHVCVRQWWTVPVSFSRCALYLYSTFLWRPAENQPAYRSPIEQIHSVFQPNRVIVRGCMHAAQSMHCCESLSPKLMPIEACYEFPQANTISISPWVQGITSALLHCGRTALPIWAGSIWGRVCMLITHWSSDFCLNYGQRDKWKRCLLICKVIGLVLFQNLMPPTSI